MIPILDLSPEINELREEINEAIARVINNTNFIMGEEVAGFEADVAKYLGTKHAIGVNSGTDALVIALRALGIGKGDEVITTPFSFFATAESISMVGAKPVFVDIDPVTYNIDHWLIEKAITKKTKAIMPVHLFGLPCEMTRIMEIAEKHKLKVVEDCAQSFGAKYPGKCQHCDCNEGIRKKIKGKHTGTIGHAGAYSFFPSKNLGAFGDAGLIATDDDAVAELARMLRAHGAKKKYHNEIMGYNSRLDTIQAAILKVKLPHIDRWNEGRRQAAARYKELFKGFEEVLVPETAAGHVFHQYTIKIYGTNRDKVQASLKKKGIGTMVYYPVPQDKLPVYEKDYEPQPISAETAEMVLSLPIWPSITEELQGKVATAVKETIREVQE